MLVPHLLNRNFQESFLTQAVSTMKTLHRDLDWQCCRQIDNLVQHCVHNGDHVQCVRNVSNVAIAEDMREQRNQYQKNNQNVFSLAASIKFHHWLKYYHDIADIAETLAILCNIADTYIQIKNLVRHRGNISNVVI
jgi:hypothetical protein